MSRQAIKDLRSRQQVKDKEINYLLATVEKNLEEYKIALKTKEKQLSDTKKILVSAKQSYDKTVAENRDLKAYVEKLKQHIQQQQVQFLEKQKNYYRPIPKKYKKVVYQEESESEPEFAEEEQEEQEESEKREKKLIGKKPKIKKAPSKRERQVTFTTLLIKNTETLSVQ